MANPQMWSEIGRSLGAGGDLIINSYDKIQDDKFNKKKRDLELEDMIQRRLEAQDANFRAQQEESRRQRDYAEKERVRKAQEELRNKENEYNRKRIEQIEKQAFKSAEKATELNKKADAYTEKTAQTLNAARQLQGIPTQNNVDPQTLPEIGVQGGWGDVNSQIDSAVQDSAQRLNQYKINDVNELENQPLEEQTFEPWDMKRRLTEAYRTGAIDLKEYQDNMLNLQDREPGGRYAQKQGQNRGNAEVAKNISDRLKNEISNNPNFSRKDMLRVILESDPDGTFIGTQDGGRLLSAVSPQEAIRSANLAAKKFGYDQQQDIKKSTKEEFKTDLQLANEYVENYRKNSSPVNAGVRIDNAIKKMGFKDGIFGDVGNLPGLGFRLSDMWNRITLKGPEAEFKSNVQLLINGFRNGQFGASLSEGERAAFEEFANTGKISNEAMTLSAIRSMIEDSQSKLGMILTDGAARMVKKAGYKLPNEFVSQPGKTFGTIERSADKTKVQGNPGQTKVNSMGWTVQLGQDGKWRRIK